MGLHVLLTMAMVSLNRSIREGSGWPELDHRRQSEATQERVVMTHHDERASIRRAFGLVT